jgi:glutaredoxin 2
MHCQESRAKFPFLATCSGQLPYRLCSISGVQVFRVLVAFTIVTPIAWLAMNHWMQSFADRTAINWWIFGLSG